jgi:hypothetical protein
MEARIVRGELQKCYRGEGVNQLQNCKELAERYASMIRENKVCRFSVLVYLQERVADEFRSRGSRSLIPSRWDLDVRVMRSKVEWNDVLYGINTFAGILNTYLNHNPDIAFHYLRQHISLV